MDAAEGGTKGVSAAQASRMLLEDAARTQAARRLLRAGEGSAALQNLAALAARLLGTPSAEVSLLTEVRVIVAAVGALPGPPGTRTPLEDALCTQVAASGERLVVSDAATDQRVAAVAAVTSGALGAYLAVPLVSDDRRVVGAICAYQPAARQWSDQDVSVMENLAAAAAAQLEVSALDRAFADVDRDELLKDAAHAAGLGTFRWDLRLGTLVWDDPLLQAFGYDEESFSGTIDAFNARVHPEDLPNVTRALDTAIDSCGIYEAEFRVLRPDGTIRWLIARGRAVPGPSGAAVQVLGVTTDTSALRAGEDRLRHVLESMTVAYFRVDRDWRFTYVNAEAERVLGRPRHQLLGQDLWTLFPAAVGSDFEASYRRVAATGDTVVFDAYYPDPLDAWFEVRAVPDGDGVGSYFTDVTARRRALAASERAHRLSAMLAKVAAELAEAPNAVAALDAVLPHLVPAVADFAIASLLDAGSSPWRQRLRDVAACASDPRVEPVLNEYLTQRIPALTDQSPVARALATGRPAAVADAVASAATLLEGGPALDLLHQLSPGASLVLPLRGRGHTHGLITVVRRAGREPFGDDDVTDLQEVVAQIGVALDNLHLHAARRDLAEELQRSLLTALPEPDHLHLVARYIPASTGAQIGGDWYDAFLVRDGSTCLVIGDVTGHDLRAAVGMAQIRNVLRGSAHAVVQPPALILQSLDWAMHDLEIGVISSAIVAKIEQTADLAERGLRRLRWSSAGHPPPLVIHGDGRTELLQAPNDLLLGVTAHTTRRDHEVLLEPGSTLLLYTDGLVERRGESLTEGLRRLSEVAQTLVQPPLEEFCDRVVSELAHASHDDVALLAVRLHPEDQPRPAEAGPVRLPNDPAAHEPNGL